MSNRDISGSILVNHWQYGVPVYRERIFTPTLKFLAGLAIVGLGLAVARFFSPLGPFSGMNDAYAWGIWKTFNVMTLTALGSAPLAVGLATWVLNRKKLHIVMRTALVCGLVFYSTGLIALGFDVGRTWNFYNVLFPWRWNAHSAMLEVAVCMPLYCCLFLAFESLPMVLERIYYTGSDDAKAKLREWAPKLRRIYPFMITGAYVLPLMHQSSLGGLLLLAGDKISPLWQSPMLPFLYVVAACLCGLGFMIYALCIACLRYARPLDIAVLSELGSLLSWICFGFLFFQCVDLILRGQLRAAFRLDTMSVVLLAQMALILIPGVLLRKREVRETPHTLVDMSVLACLGGLSYRFIPTTIGFHPASGAVYFPSVSEFLITVGYIAFGICLVSLAVRYFAVLPGEIRDWNHMFNLAEAKERAPRAR